MVFWSVQVEWFVGGGNECTFVEWWWLLGAKVRVRWETDGVCVMRVTSMHVCSRMTSRDLNTFIL